MNGSAARVEAISGRFLGYPYIANPLIGSADITEVFSDSLKGFDCVTYLETVLALLYAGGNGKFSSILKQIRYADGKVNWRSRNHYMTDWIRNNVRSGLVQRVVLKGEIRRKERILSEVPGLPPKKQRFSCVSKQSLSKSAGQLECGDLIFFASTRAHLDVFHCGVLIWKDGNLLLRHASRSQGRVVEQELESFLKQNRMAGVLLARPVDRSRR